MYCPQCGNNVPEEAAFCSKCGQDLKARTVEETVPAYPAQQKVVANHMALAIISLFLFLPLGIPALVFANKVDSFLAMGNIALAQENAQKAKTFGWVAIGIGAALILLCVVLFVVALASVPYSFYDFYY